MFFILETCYQFFDLKFIYTFASVLFYGGVSYKWICCSRLLDSGESLQQISVEAHIRLVEGGGWRGPQNERIFREIGERGARWPGWRWFWWDESVCKELLKYCKILVRLSEIAALYSEKINSSLKVLYTV